MATGIDFASTRSLGLAFSPAEFEWKASSTAGYRQDRAKDLRVFRRKAILGDTQVRSSKFCLIRRCIDDANWGTLMRQASTLRSGRCREFGRYKRSLTALQVNIIPDGKQ